MRKQIFSLLTSLLTISAVSMAQVEQVTENQVGISERLQMEIEMTKDPALGYVPKTRLFEAYQSRKLRLSQPSLQGTSFTWTERGPYSDAVGSSNGNTRPGNGKTSGRVRAIWQDLGDPTGKLVWVGGIDGGLWKTNDVTANPASWIPINDFFGNLSVASICQDPTDINIMYFGTGEKAINADAVRGGGIWRSTDHGANWSLMPGTSGYWNVSKMICDASGNLYVGCNSTSNNTGLVRFTKATSSWTNITPSGLAARIPDIELSSTGRLHITCGYYNTVASSSGYRYTDNPATVTSSTWSSPSTSFTTQYNVDLASSGNTLYALPANSAFEVATIYKSTNGGVNWSAITTPASLTNGQAWYDIMVAVDPKNANNVIIGGLNVYRSTNGGSSWTQVSNWVGTSGQYVHADQQCAVWDMNDQILIGSDGGVHYSNNGGTIYSDRNVGLRIKQFYSVAIHPTSTNYFLAGAQDNGSHQLTQAGLSTSVEVTGGDGAFVHIDQDQPQYQWTSYVYNQYRRSTNSGGSWSSVNYSSSAGRFINPTDYDDAANIMYCSGNAGQFVRWSNPQSGSTFTAVNMSAIGSGKVSAIKVSPYTANTVFFAGQASGVTPSLIKATNANATPTFTSIIGTGMTTSSAYISSIELGTSEQYIIVCYANYGVNNVWVSTNGGTSWTTIDGNLPDMPVRWAMFYPGDNTQAIIATETGIWQTSLINGSSTVWNPEPGFPNVRVDMLQYRASDGLLAAATHGRGVFTTFINASTPTCGTVSGLSAASITTNSATVSWSALGGAVSYDVDYKQSTSGTWINAATATSSLSASLSGLNASSLYDYRVRANCSGATGSYATGQFTTATPPSCGTVSGLNASSITTSGASLSWSALSGALNYDVDYKLNSSGTWTNLATATTSLSASLSGLTASTLYDYRVRANCSGATGAYAAAQFTTATPSCGTVSGLNASNITTSSASIAWSALSGALNYDVDYKLNSSGTWINLATATSSLSANLSGLSASSVYDYRVRANCSGATGAYATAQFTTAAAPSCGTVTGLSSFNITTTSASISWSALSGALNYDVDYKLSGSGTWINVATATTSLTANLSGLSASSSYDYRVRANCTGATGAYSVSQFTTDALPSCGTVTGLSAGAISTSGATINWSALSGALNYDVDYKLNSSSTWTNAATASTSLSVVLSGLTESSLYDYRVRANCTGATGDYNNAQFTTLTPAPACPGIYDVTGNSTPAGAATIPFETDVYGTITSTTENDYFKFVITTAGTATLTLSSLPANYDLYLYSGNGTSQLAVSKLTGNRDESISYNFAAGTYYVMVTGAKKAFNATTCYVLNIQLGTASSQVFQTDLPNLQLKVFPNPAQQKLSVYLLSDNTVKTLQLYDLNGKLVYQQRVTDLFTTLDIHRLAKGLYVLKIKSEDGKLLRTEKIIKN